MSVPLQKRKDEDDRSVQDEDSWKEYFERISDVCPWSLEAFNNNEIQFFQEINSIRKLGNNKANLYILSNFSVDDIYELAEELDELYEEYEFLWSHPEHTKGGNRSTIVPVLIQQDKEYLEYLRGTKSKKA